MKLRAAPALIDTCVLAALSRSGAHDKAIHAKTVLDEVRGIIELEREELEQSLARLGEGGFLESYDWSQEGKRCRLYRITAVGRCRLEQNLAEWDDYIRRVNGFLRP